jgi:hypothetical protein
MNTKRSFLALALGLGLTLGLFWLLGNQSSVVLADPGILYVAPDGNCGGAAPCYPSIQAAVDAASAGDEIRVAAGTYDNPQMVIDSSTGYTYTQVVFIDKSLTLLGGYDPGDWNADPDPTANPTIIDAERQGRGVSIVGAYGDYPSVTVDGFTITGGDYTGLGNPAGAVNQVCRSIGGSDCGGGLYAHRSALTLRNCVVSDNVASRNNYGHNGGGIYLWVVSPSGSPASRIENTTIISNSAHWGGGMYVTEVDNPLTITHSSFQDNYADNSGGGLALASNIEALVTIAETGFLSNTAQTGRGGGAYIGLVRGEILQMDRVRMSGNEAGTQGAALYLGKAGTGLASARLTNLLLTSNRSTSGNATDAVIAIAKGYDFDVTLAHLTAAGNPAPTFLRAEAPYSGRFLTVTLTNTLVTSATNGFVGYQRESDGSLLIRHTNTLTDDVTTLHFMEEGTPTLEAINPLSGDPRLDAIYHLQPGSAAIDTGVDAGVTTDIDGDARPDGCSFDIGADEFPTDAECKRIYLPVALRKQ